MSRPRSPAPPDGYETWPAERKLAWLWEDVIGSTAHRMTDLPGLDAPFAPRPISGLALVLRRRTLVRSLLRTEDLMEDGREKVIHRRGAVAVVDLETDPASPFTGLLAPPPSGGATGLLRLSLVAKVTGKKAITPGFGLKLLVDGRPSADVLAMNHTVGQGRDFNVFSNSMTNDLTDEHRELRTPQRVMSRLFTRVSEEPRRLIVDHLAERDRDGAAVAEPRAPRRLVFEPTATARDAFVGQAGVDFRRVLASIPEGTALYDVAGLRGPARSRERVAVGVLRTRTAFVSSDGGDRLFFRHVQDPADVRS
ncbi:MAG: hypothetical protein AAFZ07_19775 [Actinomycetota bacterium]